MIKKQELADKVKELEGTLRVSEDQVDRFIEIRDRMAKENRKLEERIQSLEQLVPKEKLEELDDGTIYRL
jgi:phage shock protein A